MATAAPPCVTLSKGRMRATTPSPAWAMPITTTPALAGRAPGRLFRKSPRRADASCPACRSASARDLDEHEATMRKQPELDEQNRRRLMFGAIAAAAALVVWLLWLTVPGTPPANEHGPVSLPTGPAR